MQFKKKMTKTDKVHMSVSDKIGNDRGKLVLRSLVQGTKDGKVNGALWSFGLYPNECGRDFLSSWGCELRGGGNLCSHIFNNYQSHVKPESGFQVCCLKYKNSNKTWTRSEQREWALRNSENSLELEGPPRKEYQCPPCPVAFYRSYGVNWKKTEIIFIGIGHFWAQCRLSQ